MYHFDTSFICPKVIRMYEIKLNKDDNRLTVILQGNIGKIEGEKAGREIVAAVNQLQRGFSVITDISTFETANGKNDDVFRKAMQFMKVRGVGTVIRVVGGSKAGLVKFAQLTKNVRDYSVQYVTTIEAAEKLLKS